jgi:hypothetical protein
MSWHYPTVMPLHVRRWDYNREGPAVEGKMAGMLSIICSNMQQHCAAHSCAG